MPYGIYTTVWVLYNCRNVKKNKYLLDIWMSPGNSYVEFLGKIGKLNFTALTCSYGVKV